MQFQPPPEMYSVPTSLELSSLQAWGNLSCGLSLPLNDKTFTIPLLSNGILLSHK